MILWANYKKLYNAFRQRNDYKFGLLSPHPKSYIIKPSKNVKAIPLIDGILYLFRHETKKEALEEALKNSLPENHQFIKKNLKHLNQTIKLSVYQVRYDEKLKRAVIEPNRNHIKALLKIIYKITHTKWPSKRIMIKRVNDYVEILKDMSENSLMKPEQKRAIQRKLKEYVVEGLTSMYKLKPKEAEEDFKIYVKKMYFEK